ncbi:MAG: peptidase T [Saprospiraceae bacterium]|nr:peptidase T [Saprospiraceae bacterium]
MEPFKNAFQNIAERFMRYTRIDTQSNPFSDTVPSTAKQLDLSKLLVEELTHAGIKDVELDEFGYVYATLPATSNKDIPVICFCAHVDTAPDCSGSQVKPILHLNYQLQDLLLPDDPTLQISPKEFPELLTKSGEDIITASGLTLLGADDKAGVAAIMEAALYLHHHPEIAHGKIRLLFTPDEEIGRGVNHVSIPKLGAHFGYTLDGGELGSLEDETFSADAVIIKITGVSTHPGYAKNKMENAIKIAADIVAALPLEHLIPEKTSGMQGFVHPVKVDSELEQATLHFIIRDFETSQLAVHEDYLKKVVDRVLNKYPNSSYTFTISEQYRNMKEILSINSRSVDFAEQAIGEAGLDLLKGSIRGGTDGSRLSFMGLPCPNLFAGEHGIHSKKEWVSVQDMQKAAEVIVRICQISERYA